MNPAYVIVGALLGWALAVVIQDWFDRRAIRKRKETGQW